jgi:hypothetical protein
MDKKVCSAKLIKHIASRTVFFFLDVQVLDFSQFIHSLILAFDNTQGHGGQANATSGPPSMNCKVTNGEMG